MKYEIENCEGYILRYINRVICRGTGYTSIAQQVMDKLEKYNVIPYKQDIYDKRGYKLTLDYFNGFTRQDGKRVINIKLNTNSYYQNIHGALNLEEFLGIGELSIVDSGRYVMLNIVIKDAPNELIFNNKSE